MGYMSYRGYMGYMSCMGRRGGNQRWQMANGKEAWGVGIDELRKLSRLLCIVVRSE